MKIKYSFIVPVYGCEEYLESCVESILAQRGNHAFEIILVDDGSKDRSGQIADMLAGKDLRVRTFHKENGGAASARNFGLAQAKGEYILFVDSDDTVEDRLLDSVDAVLAENPQALVIFGMAFDYYRGKTQVRSEILSCGHTGVFPVGNLLENYQSFFLDNALSSACNKVFSAEIIKAQNLRLREGMTLYEDYDFVLRYLPCVEKVVCIDRPFYRYRNDLRENHLGRRVADLEKLRQNLQWLMKSSLTLSGESSQLREVSASLFLQLLWQHLLTQKYTVPKLEQCLAPWCEDRCFRTMLAEGVKLGAQEEKLYTWIQERRFHRILCEVKAKKAKAWIKRSIKGALRLVGLRK